MFSGTRVVPIAQRTNRVQCGVQRPDAGRTKHQSGVCRGTSHSCRTFFLSMHRASELRRRTIRTSAAWLGFVLTLFFLGALIGSIGAYRIKRVCALKRVQRRALTWDTIRGQSASTHAQHMHVRTLFQLRNSSYRVPITKSRPLALEPNGNAALHAQISPIELPLYGSLVHIGMYATTIEIDGSPYTLSVDTGSSSLAVITSVCDACPAGKRRLQVDEDRTLHCGSRTAPLGDPPETFSCEPDQHGICDGRGHCIYQIRYGDGTAFNGRYVAGMVGAAGRAAPMVFGGIESAQGRSPDVFGSGIEGMLGLAYPGLSCNPLCTLPFFETLLQHRLVPEDVFSLCVSDEQGRLVLGAMDSRMDPMEIRWTPIVHHLFYDIELEHVYIDGHDAGIANRHSAFVDSGTTLIALSTGAFAAFRDYLRAHYCHIPYVCPDNAQEPSILDHAACASYSPEEVRQFPNLTFTLAGAGNLTLTPLQYFVRVDNPPEPTFYCMGIAEEPSLGPSYGVEAILGLVWLRNFFTVYDRAHKRIGFQSARGCIPFTTTHPTGSGSTSDQDEPRSSAPSGHRSETTLFGSIGIFIRKHANVLLFIMAPLLVTSVALWFGLWYYRKRRRLLQSTGDTEANQAMVALRIEQDANG
jgi:hypothetical protein